MSQTPIKPDRRSPAKTPRWVKALVIIFVVLVTVFVALHLTGNSLGGPGRHTMSTNNAQQP